MSKKKESNKVNCAFHSPPVLAQSSEAAETLVDAFEAEKVQVKTIVATQSSDSAEPKTDSLSVGQADLAIKRGGEKFYDYYSAYKTIRELARPLNGLPQSAPIPRGLSIKKITVDFTANDVDYSIDIPEPQKAGEIAPLISFAIRDLVEKMNNELHILSYLVEGMYTSVQSAFQARTMAPPNEAYDNTNTTQ